MTPELWARIAEVFAGAGELPRGRREAYLAEHCPDPEARAEVERLLEGDERAGLEDFLRPMVEGPREGALGDPRRDARRGLHLRCPHCRGPIEILEAAAPLEATCPACGSTFRVESGSTEDWDSGPSRRSFGRFEIVHWLGDGAFGTVYKARDPRLDRLVALKVPRLGNLASPADRDRFFREARTAAQLQHPSIVRVLEVDEAEGLPYIAAELVEGVTLADRLSAPPLRPDFGESARLIAGLADALDYAHRRGVIHRDVKPSNILLDGQGRALIADFGLAKRTAGEATIAADGRPLGTPAYMSPEQARGEAGTADGRTDVYGLGAVLYELVTGEPPFRGTARMVLHQALNDEPRPPRRLNDRVPRDLETICLKAMAKEPAGRYATAGDLAADLRRHLAGEPILARPVGRIERAWRWCRRNPRLAAASAVAAIALVATAGISATLAFQQGRAAENERQAADNERTLRGDAERAGRLASYQAANSLMHRGLAANQVEEISTGLLLLARALRLAPGEATDIGSLLRSNIAAHGANVHRLRAAVSHGRGVRAVALDPSGSWFVTGGRDHTARLWDARTGRPIGRPLVHDGDVVGLAISPDGRSIATASLDRTARIWDAATGAARMTLPIPEAEVWGVAFGPAGAWLATSDGGGKVRRWDVATGAPIGETLAHGAAARAVAVSTDGTRIASGHDCGHVGLWDVATGKRIGEDDQESMHHHNSVHTVAFSRDGKRLTSGGADWNTYLWDTRTGEKLGTRAYSGMVWSVAFGLGDDRLLVGLETRAGLVIDLHGGSTIGSTLPGDGPILAVAASGDGRTLLTAGDDGMARVWDAATTRTAATMPHPNRVDDVAFGPDGRWLLSGCADGKARLWDAADGHLLWTSPEFAPFDHECQWVDVSADGLAIAANGERGLTRIWRIRDGRPVGPNGEADDNAAPSRTLDGGSAVFAMAFHPTDPKRLATAGSDGRVRVWDVSDGHLLRAFGAADDALDSVSWSPDGRLIACGDGAGAVRIFEAATGRVAGPILRGDGPIKATEFSPDGKLLASAGKDQTLRLWDVATGRQVRKIFNGADVWDVAFSPDGRTVACVCSNYYVRFWDVATGLAARLAYFSNGPAWAVDFRGDGREFAVGSNYGVSLWRADHRREGTPDRIELWAEVITGSVLDLETGFVRTLDRAAWQARRDQLDRLGGPPLE